MCQEGVEDILLSYKRNEWFLIDLTFDFSFNDQYFRLWKIGQFKEIFWKVLQLKGQWCDEGCILLKSYTYDYARSSCPCNEGVARLLVTEEGRKVSSCKYVLIIIDIYVGRFSKTLYKLQSTFSSAPPYLKPLRSSEKHLDRPQTQCVHATNL